MTKSLRLSFLVIFSFFAFHTSKACSPLNVPTLTSQSISGSNLILNWSSNTIYNCSYFVQVEFACSPGSFTGTGTPAFYNTATIAKTSTPFPYPTQTISIASLCPGTTYMFRAREVYPPATYSGWTATYTFTTPGTFTMPTLSLTATPSVICVPATSQLNATITSSCGPYPPTYSWTPTASLSNPTIANPIASPTITTTYTCTVTGGPLGCWSATSSITITTTTAPVPGTASVSPGSVCSGTPVTLTLAGYTGSIQWQSAPVSGGPWTNIPGATTTPFVTAGLTSNTCFQAVVTGCSAATSNVVCVTVNTAPVTTVNSVTMCPGQTATLTAAGATSYLWDTGSTANPLTVSPVVTTSYTVTGTTSGCTSTAVATVTIGGSASPTVNSPTICTGQTATLTATGGTSYTWDTGSTANPLSVTPLVTTSYTVTATNGGCTGTAVATVTVIPSLVVNAGLNDTICYGGNTVLNVTPNGAGYIYDWTPVATLTGATTANPIATPTSTTTYSVTLTDASGCSGTSTVTIYADTEITVAIAGIDVTCNGACNGQTIVIPSGGTSGYSYLWSSGCTGASCTSLCPGSYSVTVTDAWGCTATNDTSIVEPTLLTATSVVTPASCNGVCDGNATATASGGTVGSGYSYSWNTVPVQTTSTANGLCAGTYICTITDANSCTATVTATVTEPSLVVIAPIAPVTICSGASTMITASASGGNGGAYSYSWSPATGLDFTNIANPTATPAATTVYTVNATDVNGCAAAPVTVTVTVNPTLSVVASGTASICLGGSTSISAVASMGNGGPYTYTWAPAGTGSGTPISVSPTATTTYTVTADDGCSPTATATVTVTVSPLPVVVFSAPVTSGCAPLCVNFTDNSTVAGGSISTWSWDFGDGNTSNSSAPTNCYNIPGTYSVNLTVSSSVGGCTSSVTYPAYVTAHPNPVADFTAPLSTSIINPVVTYNDNSSISGGSIVSWAWNFGDAFASTADNTSTLQNPTHVFTEDGTYCASLTVTSNFGCIDATLLCIEIEPEFTFFIPNAFTPNDDGVNDEFFGKGDYIKKFEMFIYDRWGNLIFFADDINKHWDGKANHGKEMSQEDVYVYTVKITDTNDKKHKYIGTVTIVK